MVLDLEERPMVAGRGREQMQAWGKFTCREVGLEHR